jgi:hypothetical protein
MSLPRNAPVAFSVEAPTLGAADFDPAYQGEGYPMSIFGNIMSAIFGSRAATATPLPPSASGAPQSGGAASAPSGSTTAAAVDVAAILDKAVAAQKEKLDWRNSIVDMMKALNLDSSLAARKELATELKYTGDTNDSAKMNVWLHQQMMKNLAANGGKLPADVKW